MQFLFDAILQARKNLLNEVANCSVEQLHLIPNGFRNNLIWNLGHVLVTQQLLCYGLSNTPLLIPPKLVGLFRKGTVPADSFSPSEIQEIKELLISTSHALQADFQANKFHEFKPYPTSFGLTLNSIEEAIQFDLGHEAMHLGTVLALKKLV